MIDTLNYEHFYFVITSLSLVDLNCDVMSWIGQTNYFFNDKPYLNTPQSYNNPKVALQLPYTHKLLIYLEYLFIQ